MSNEAPPRKSNRTTLVVGSVLGVGLLVCGLGGAVVAAVGGWWYMQQPQSIRFTVSGLDVQSAAPVPLPSPLLVRRYGEPEPVLSPVTWSVEPDTLGTVTGGVFTPEGPGQGMIQACAGEVCGTVPVTVVVADTITPEPSRVSVREWGPRALKAVATWRTTPTTVPFTWASTDAKVVTVDASGNATPVGAGAADVTVSGGGATASVHFRVFAPAPTPCTLSAYADAVGRTGQRSETKQCQPGAPDFCEWTASQPLADGGRIDEGGGWEWGWTTLWLPAADADQIWPIAQRCMGLPPEITSLPMLEMLRSPGREELKLAIKGSPEGTMATVTRERGAVTIELPTEACYAGAVFGLDGQWMKIGVSEGC